jgi:hypothetical protein
MDETIIKNKTYQVRDYLYFICYLIGLCILGMIVIMILRGIYCFCESIMIQKCYEIFNYWLWGTLSSTIGLFVCILLIIFKKE